MLNTCQFYSETAALGYDFFFSYDTFCIAGVAFKTCLTVHNHRATALTSLSIYISFDQGFVLHQ